MKILADECKNVFKGLREKYIREREKFQNGQLPTWEMFHHLTFLEPHIVERQKYSIYNSPHNNQKESSNMNVSHCNPQSFDRNLINIVRKTEQIWNRNSNSYTMNRSLKNELWKEIGKKLNRDERYCMLRWKALREKYIRQKNKAQQLGEPRWELLEDLQFLDPVILYRRKADASACNYSIMNQQQSFNDLHNELVARNNEHFYPASDDNSLNDSNEMTIKLEVETESPDSSLDMTQNDQTDAYPYVNPDSSYRNTSDIDARDALPSENDEPDAKKAKTDEDEGSTPEKLFGNMVVLMLMRKPEAERNLAMVEIMKVLSK